MYSQSVCICRALWEGSKRVFEGRNFYVGVELPDDQRIALGEKRDSGIS